MKRTVICAILASLVAISVTTSAFAGGAGEHWEDMREVLFGSMESFASGAIQERREILEQATSLAIDQYQGSGGSYLKNLQCKGVPGLPTGIDAIDLKANANHHREYTHCGWDYPYKSDSENPQWAEISWPLRQNILRASVEYVFDFNGLPSWLDSIFGYQTEKGEAFCKLLYCIHVLGDHKAYTPDSYQKHKGKILPMAGFSGETSIITELLACFQVLFPTQTYYELENELEAVNIELRSMLNNEGAWTDNTTDFKKYTDQAEKMLEILSRHIPTLLHNESFFTNAFPLHASCKVSMY